jgi:hypothetical protein
LRLNIETAKRRERDDKLAMFDAKTLSGYYGCIRTHAAPSATEREKDRSQMDGPAFTSTHNCGWDKEAHLNQGSTTAKNLPAFELPPASKI